MVIDPQHEDTLIEALRHLWEAKSLVDQISREIGDDGGKRERLIQDELKSMAKRISSARRDGAKLIPRRPDFRLDDDPFRPKWRRSEEPPRLLLRPRRIDARHDPHRHQRRGVRGDCPDAPVRQRGLRGRAQRAG